MSADLHRHPHLYVFSNPTNWNKFALCMQKSMNLALKSSGITRILQSWCYSYFYSVEESCLDGAALAQCAREPYKILVKQYKLKKGQAQRQICKTDCPQVAALCPHGFGQSSSFQRKNRQSMTKFWMKSDQSQKNANQNMSNYRFCVMGWELVEEQARNDKDKMFRLFYFMWMPQFVQVPCLKGFSPTSETGTCARWRCWHVFLAKTNSVRRAKTWLKQRARRTSRVTIPINLDFIAFQLCKMWYLKSPNGLRSNESNVPCKNQFAYPGTAPDGALFQHVWRWSSQETLLRSWIPSR